MRSDVSRSDDLGWVTCLARAPHGHEDQEDGQRPGGGVAHEACVQQEVGQGHLVPEPPQGDPGRVVVQLPGAGAPAQALGHGVVVDGGGQHQPRHLPLHTVLAVQTLDLEAVMAIEAGAQLVEAAHNPDNLAVVIGLVSGSPSYLMTGLARPLITCHLPGPLSVSSISGMLG